MPNLDSRLNDADVQRVIARALELQATSAQTLTIAQIREIASELSISESAVDQALVEYQAESAQAIQRADSSASPDFWHRHRAGRRLVISLGVAGGALVLLIVVTVMTRLFFGT